MQAKDLLKYISSDEYITAEYLAEQFHVSTKTIRLRIKELNEEAKSYSFSVESKARYGYILAIDDLSRYMEYTEVNHEYEIPETTEERVNYLLAYLLNHEEYVKLDDLCEFLYVSRPTIKNTLKNVEHVLRQYSLVIERRPGYGLRVCGSEFDIRRCIGDNFVKRNKLSIKEDASMNERMKRIAKTVLPLLQEYEIHLAETALENFIEQIYVAVTRMHRGKYTSMKREEVNNLSDKEWELSSELLERLVSQEKISFLEDEVVYIVIYLKGKRMMGSVSCEESNFIIKEDIDTLSMKMLNLIFQDFRMDFRTNFDIRMILNQHMVPMDIRLKYDIQLKNPQLEEIKKKYIMAYTMAAHASSILAEIYKKEVIEDEIGYLALIFALAMEQNVCFEKVDILIVCSSGKGSSRLLMYKYRQEFGQYINKIYVCDIDGLDQFDFSKVAYVFTTVSITKFIPRTIMEVGLFLEDSDRVAVRNLLEKGEKAYFNQYYKESHFFTDISGESKKEILKKICDRAGSLVNLPPGFYEAVLKREELAQTDFGNFIAIPHPYRTMTEETLVFVTVLEKPVIWSKYPVQVIFLIAVGTKDDENLEKFYADTTKLILRPKAVSYLIEQKTYEALIGILKKEEYHIE